MRTLIAFGLAAALAACADAREPRTVTFDPPYPETNKGGDPILAVFEGRVPCTDADAAGCSKRKVSLVLYAARATGKPATYWLGVIAVPADERVVSEGTWSIRRGITGYAEATAYELGAHAPADLKRFWRVSNDVLLPLDEHMTPKPGNSAWGYMLSRYAEPYGPRTYVID